MRRPGTARPIAPGGVAYRAWQPTARCVPSVSPKSSFSEARRHRSMSARRSAPRRSPPVMTARSAQRHTGGRRVGADPPKHMRDEERAGHPVLGQDRIRAAEREPVWAGNHRPPAGRRGQHDLDERAQP